MIQATRSCLRCRAPLAPDAAFCSTCGVSVTAAATGEYTQYDLERFFSYAVDLLCIAGLDGYFKRVNPAFERVLGYQAGELLSTPFVNLIHPDDRTETVAEVQRLSSGQATIRFHNRYRCKDGSYRHIQWTSFPEPATGLLYAIGRDVTDVRRDAAMHDALTGFLTLEAFDRRLHEEWNRAKRFHLPLSMIVLDVDRLRTINEQFGFTAGDECLAAIARVVRDRTHRSSDVVARTAGQRISVVLFGVRESVAADFAEYIRAGVEALEMPLRGPEGRGRITVSAGVAAACPETGGGSVESLIVDAERALAEAKRQGRNIVQAA